MLPQRTIALWPTILVQTINMREFVKGIVEFLNNSL